MTQNLEKNAARQGEENDAGRAYAVECRANESQFVTQTFPHRFHAAERAADMIALTIVLAARDGRRVHADAARDIPVSIRLAVIEEDGTIDAEDMHVLHARIAAQVDRLVHADGAYRFEFGNVVVIVGQVSA